MSSQKSLGLVTVPERTMELDLTLLERFQEFSAELLRLSLLGISALGFIVSKVLFPGDEKSSALSALTGAKGPLSFALFFFGLCAAAALVHRYYATDSMSWHLQAMRRYQRGNELDAKAADAETRVRFRRFKVARYSIMVAATSLGLGALAITVTIWWVL